MPRWRTRFFLLFFLGGGSHGQYKRIEEEATNIDGAHKGDSSGRYRRLEGVAVLA